MDADTITLILVVTVIVIFIVLKARRSSSESLLRKAYYFEEKKQYLEAIDYYSRYSLLKAAEMVLRTPEASQVLVLRRLEKKFSQAEIENAFIKLARRFTISGQIDLASASFILANKPFAAAKVYVDKGDLKYVPQVVQIIDKYSSLIHDRDQAIRNLAKHAYNSRKYKMAAEFLRTLGADEEANAVLIAAAVEMKKQGFTKKADTYLRRTGKPSIALKHYLDEIEKALRSGEIEKMRRSLSYAKGLVNQVSVESDDSSNSSKPIIHEIKEYDRLLKILDSARDILRKKQMNQAIALYDELIEGLGPKIPSPILAEAALANEPKNPSRAIELYEAAAKTALTTQAAESFRLRAKKLRILTQTSSIMDSSVSVEGTSELLESCVVCRNVISDISTMVRCPECGSPAHYSHLAEWLKMRGVCPICKKRIKIKRPKNSVI
ncbi:MAG: hypothetical protein ACTSR2_01270 [Candidatus Hodarchaeales archaeon]